MRFFSFRGKKRTIFRVLSARLAQLSKDCGPPLDSREEPKAHPTPAGLVQRYRFHNFFSSAEGMRASLMNFRLRTASCWWAKIAGLSWRLNEENRRWLGRGSICGPAYHYDESYECITCFTHNPSDRSTIM